MAAAPAAPTATTTTATGEQRIPVQRALETRATRNPSGRAQIGRERK